MSTYLNENQLKRKNLDEVSFIRPVLIILLVMYHAFAPWCDSWRAFDGFKDVELYWWIGKLSYSFMLPTFVFISGYVWAFQREELNKKDSLTDLAKKKFKRLFIPSIVFGLLYLPLLPGFPFGGGSNLVYTSFLKVIQGTAHMWFLPMLFWCFLICYGILEIANKKVRMCIIALCVALSIIPLPFQFGSSLYYILYFYFGYEMWCRNSQEPINSDKKRILLAWGLFFVCFFILTAIVRCYFETGTNSALVKIISFYMYRICAIVYSISGLYAIYIVSPQNSFNKLKIT